MQTASDVRTDLEALTSLEVSDDASIGRAMWEFIAELTPICRSITGNGVRQTLAHIAAHIPLRITEIPSGTAVLDWHVPNEWNIKDAYVLNSRGEKVVDFQRCPLHVLGYSTPVRGRYTLDELRPHLYTDAAHPEWIPFRYSYYTENWGFCLAQNALDKLVDGDYEVLIDSSLGPGSLTYGECFVPGTTEEEVLISVHTCHPWMCNDNLSGIAVATALAKRLSLQRNRLSYRFLFMPTTIGSISWLSRNEASLDRVKHGLVLTCVGDKGDFQYKQTREGGNEVDRAMIHALKQSGKPFNLLEFSPFGFDERQYSSPGFNLPVGCLMRTPHGEYPEYHTSADDLSFVLPDKLAGSLRICQEAFEALDRNAYYINTSQRGEPQLTKRGIFRAVGGSVPTTSHLAMLWVLNLSDGSHSLLNIAERSGISFNEIRRSADLLLKHDLLSHYEVNSASTRARGQMT